MNNYVLLTGASSGVGREIAIQLSQNHNLVLNGRNSERLLETKNKCSPQANVLIWQYDLYDIDHIEESLKKWIDENKVGIESFIHCAGIMKMLPCKMYTAQNFEEIYRVNVFSAALLVKILNKKKINNDLLKSVVFISSNISNRGASSFGIYGSSKSALDGLMRNLAIELAPKVRLNSVLPGGMITEMTKDIFGDEELRKKFEDRNQLGIGSPDKLIPLIELLISDQADWITGQQFVVDGGRTIDITEK